MVDYEALCRHLDADGDRPFGLVSQQASPTGGILHERVGARLACLFSPEHGWFGLAAAGEKTGHETHPFWGIPIHSLYGETRRPTPAMLAGVLAARWAYLAKLGTFADARTCAFAAASGAVWLHAAAADSIVRADPPGDPSIVNTAQAVASLRVRLERN